MKITMFMFLFLTILLSPAFLRAEVRRSERGRDVRTPVEMQKESDGTGFNHPGDYGREIKFEGSARYYELHVPALYDKSKPTPAVLVFHGGGGDPGAVRYESGMDKTSDEGGFIAVYPGGHPSKWFTKSRLLLWNDGRPDKDGKFSKVDDVGFVMAVLDDLAKRLNIDKKRIYAAGYSNGAQFTYRLAKRLSDRIAAISTIAGNRPPKDEFDPVPSRPMPVMQFSGKEDPISPYNGGRPPGAAALSAVIQPVNETVKSWVEFDKCPPEPSATKRVGQTEMKRWGPCQCGTEVVLWTLETGGHTWPGGRVMPNVEALGLGKLGNIDRNINASDLMWDFFKNHPLDGCGK
ncbi:MAG: hypothetical protein M0R70_09415 [Nitrospirae bacterium]|nr:hypothetical protein [Nitrospirota bacterium]